MSNNTLDTERCALIIIDMQEDFASPSGAAYVDSTAEIVPLLAGIAALFRKYKKEIIHVIRLYYPDGSNAELCRKHLITSGKKIVSPHSPGSKVLAGLLPNEAKPVYHDELLKGKINQVGDYDYVMYKPRWGAFFETRLDEILKAKGITTLFIVGCNFPNCPRTTLYEASERDYKLAIVASAISGIYEKGISEIENIGVHIFKDALEIEVFLERG